MRIIKKKRLIGVMIAALCLMMLPLSALADARSGWLWPVPSYKHISRGYFVGHEGIDIPVNVGTELRAAKDGVAIVIYSGCNQSFPNKNIHSSRTSNTCSPVILMTPWNKADIKYERASLAILRAPVIHTVIMVMAAA